VSLTRRARRALAAAALCVAGTMRIGAQPTVAPVAARRVVSHEDAAVLRIARASRRGARSTAANLAIIGAVEGAAFAITWVLPEDISKWDKSRPPSYYLQRAYSRPPVWDRDPFFWNWIVHPIAGQQAYLLERNEGRGPLRGFLVATAASGGWEYGFEAFIERPSAQDLLITSPVGAVLGELSHQATRRLVRDGLRWPERAVLVVINPVYFVRGKGE
jgi:hypothetical protein